MIRFSLPLGDEHDPDTPGIGGLLTMMPDGGINVVDPDELYTMIPLTLIADSSRKVVWLSGKA